MTPPVLNVTKKHLSPLRVKLAYVILQMAINKLFSPAALTSLVLLGPADEQTTRFFERCTI